MSFQPETVSNLRAVFHDYAEILLTDCAEYELINLNIKELRHKIRDHLKQFVLFCEKNQKALQTNLFSADIQDLKTLNKKIRRFAALKDTEPELQELAGKLNELKSVLVKSYDRQEKAGNTDQILRKETASRQVDWNALPLDILVCFFHELPNLKEMVKWGLVNRRNAAISHNITSWRGSKGFNAILHARQAGVLAEFRSYLHLMHSSPKHRAFAKELASEFFNHASEQALKTCLNGTDDEGRKFFLDLIADQPLTRKHLVLSECPWLHKSPYGLDWFLTKLPDTESLDLSRTAIGDSHLAAVSQLKHLHTLHLRACDHIKLGIGHLSRLAPTLTSLQLSTSKNLAESDFQALGSLVNLTALRMTHIKSLQDSHLAFLRNLPKIEILDLSNCEELRDGVFEHVRHLAPVLSCLSMDYCHQITGAGLTSLEGFPLLHELHFKGCKELKVQSISHFKTLTALKHLDLSGCVKLTGSCMPYLPLNLETLLCSGWQAFDTEDLRPLQQLSRLHTLDLSSCSRLTSDALLPLSLSDSLASLNLANCQGLDNSAMVCIASLRNLRCLDLSGCKMQGRSLAKLGTLTRLTILSLANTAVSDSTLKKLSSLPQLASLELRECHAITTKGVLYLSKMLSLQYLGLAHCQSLDDKVLEAIKKFQSLQNVDLRVDNLSQESLADLKKSRPALKMVP